MNLKIKNIITLLKVNWKPALAVAMINIPLSIALAVASLGSSSSSIPMMGIITAIFGGLAASIFASNKHNVYGPAGSLSATLIAFLLAVKGDLLLIPILTLITAIIIFLVGKLKLSKYIMLIPASALSGFLMGIGLIIMMSQLNQALGIVPIEKTDSVVSGIIQTFSQIRETNIPTFLLFLFSFLFLFIYKFFKISKKIPGTILITIFGIAFGYIIANFYPETPMDSIKTLKTSFEGLKFSLVDFSYLGNNLIDKLKDIEILLIILKFSFSVAIIAVLETLISSKAIAKKTKTTFNKNREIFGLGMSNIFSGLAGGMPSTAVIVRTVFNADSGANSRFSSFLGSIIVLLITFLFFDYFTYIPMPVIAAILVNISIGLIDLKELSKYRKLDKVSYFIAFIVAIVTFLEDPMSGIVFGTLLALLYFIKDISNGIIYVSIFKKGYFSKRISLRKYLRKQENEDTIILKFPTAINYINTESFQEQISNINNIKNIVFSFSQVVMIDIDGIEFLDDAVSDLKNKKINIYFAGIQSERLRDILDDKLYFQELVGKKRVYESSAYVIKEIKEMNI